MTDINEDTPSGDSVIELGHRVTAKVAIPEETRGQKLLPELGLEPQVAAGFDPPQEDPPPPKK